MCCAVVLLLAIAMIVRHRCYSVGLGVVHLSTNKVFDMPRPRHPRKPPRAHYVANSLELELRTTPSFSMCTSCCGKAPGHRCYQRCQLCNGRHRQEAGKRDPTVHCMRLATIMSCVPPPTPGEEPVGAKFSSLLSYCRHARVYAAARSGTSRRVAESGGQALKMVSKLAVTSDNRSHCSCPRRRRATHQVITDAPIRLGPLSRAASPPCWETPYL
jgi:hypothetical protein